ncbi:MAG: RNA polymerase factor sigma-54 [Paludibacteraceae bacterium]|nr:RNA polymerase factor sigma-54 [Paludibacteraceae bacterium]
MQNNSLQLSTKLQQKLSPMQIQVIKMLEYPSIELEERIREEMVENPALEIDVDEVKDSTFDEDQHEEERPSADDLEWAWNGDGEDYDDRDDIPSYRLRVNNRSADDSIYRREQSNGQDLDEYLLEQLSTLNLTERERQIGEYLIGNVDANGYIRREVESLADDFAATQGVAIGDDEINHMLDVIQTLEPIGVGAFDLQECLSIQLAAKRRESSFPTDVLNLAIIIIDRNFEMFANKQYDALMRKLNVDRDLLEEASVLIRHLNPNPGANFGSGADTISQTITPDFIVENVNGKLIVSLNNGNIPELRISDNLHQMVQDYSGNTKNQTKKMKEAIQFARQKIDSARWFIDSIKQRNNTLLETMRAIVDFQELYFLTGDDRNLRPMRLKDVADKVGFDISTISRVSNSKYVETEWGVMPLKHFFSESMSTTDGEEISSKEIKTIIRETIDSEDKKSPITDDSLTEILNKKGYKIARRTVAKYREQLNIPVARLRREL